MRGGGLQDGRTKKAFTGCDEIGHDRNWKTKKWFTTGWRARLYLKSLQIIVNIEAHKFAAIHGKIGNCLTLTRQHITTGSRTFQVEFSATAEPMKKTVV